MKIASAVFTVILAASVSAQAAPQSAPQTEQQKTLYALGLLLGQNISSWNLSADDLQFVQMGLSDAAGGKTAQVDAEAYQAKVKALAQEKLTEAAKREKAASEAFLAKEKAAPKAKSYPSGLIMTVLKKGKGRSPKATDTVKVNYEGTLPDGKVFDSSYKRGQPAEFPLDAVIPCWTEAVQKLKIGGSARVVCPASIAYGEQGRPPIIPGGSALVFKVELLDIVKAAAPAAPAAPKKS